MGLSHAAQTQKSHPDGLVIFHFQAKIGRCFLVACSYFSRVLHVSSSVLTSATGTSHQVPSPGIRFSGSTGTTMTVSLNGYDGWLSIEDEDVVLSRMEGMRRSVDLLKRTSIDEPSD
jgi:hypothetical protein